MDAQIPKKSMYSHAYGQYVLIRCIYMIVITDIKYYIIVLIISYSSFYQLSKRIEWNAYIKHAGVKTKLEVC